MENTSLYQEGWENVVGKTRWKDEILRVTVSGSAFRATKDSAGSSTVVQGE